MSSTATSSEQIRLRKRDAEEQATVGQYSWGFTLLFVLASACWVLLPYTGSSFSALVFLLTVVLAGVRWHRGPVLMMAVMSALVWNFFFIPPQLTFHIKDPTDVIMFCMFFIVALAMGHLTTRLRMREAAAEEHHREREHLLRQKHSAELAAEAARLHRTLLDSVSHELKTPIAVIRTALDGLGDSGPYAAEIDMAARRLQRLVESLLEITRVESATIHPKTDWCEVSDVIHAATTPLQSELRNHPLIVTGMDAMPLVKLDTGLLAQALGNVIQNAAQYAPSGSPIHVGAAMVGDRLTLQVRDHGKGLPEGEEVKVFEKFYRVRGSPAGGTGLGLAITRGLTKAMGGEVSAENHPDGGAVFTLEVPVKMRQPSQDL
jgi:two-component system sensor histidine kinase KdpD